MDSQERLSGLDVDVLAVARAVRLPDRDAGVDEMVRGIRGVLTGFELSTDETEFLDKRYSGFEAAAARRDGCKHLEDLDVEFQTTFPFSLQTLIGNVPVERDLSWFDIARAPPQVETELFNKRRFDFIAYLLDKLDKRNGDASAVWWDLVHVSQFAEGPKSSATSSSTLPGAVGCGSSQHDQSSADAGGLADSSSSNIRRSSRSKRSQGCSCAVCK